jgi:hypothetical protein
MPNATRITEYSKIKGTSVKKPAKLATTADIFLSGLQQIDGVTASTGDRILVKDQLDATENGIYVALSTAWLRTTDFYSSVDVFSGSRVFVNDGEVNSASEWYISSPDPLTLGVSDILFSRYSFSIGGTVDNGVVTYDAAGSTLVVENNLKYDGTTLQVVNTALNTVLVQNFGIKQTGLTVTNFDPGVVIYSFSADNGCLAFVDYWIKRTEAPVVGRGGSLIISWDSSSGNYQSGDSSSAPFGTADLNAYLTIALSGSNVEVALNLFDPGQDGTYKETYEAVLSVRLIETN